MPRQRKIRVQSHAEIVNRDLMSDLLTAAPIVREIDSRKMISGIPRIRESSIAKYAVEERVGLTREGYKSAALTFLMNEREQRYGTAAARRLFLRELLFDPPPTLGGYPSQNTHPRARFGVIRMRESLVLRRVCPPV